MAKYKIKKTDHGIIHYIAHCRDCDWQNEDFIKAKNEARKHCQQTGHTIDLEKGVHISYSKVGVTFL